MIPRYTRPEMGRIWAPERRFRIWLDVELAACEAMVRLGEVPPEDYAALRGVFDGYEITGGDVARIDEIEKTVKHDVIAFLTSVADYIGDDSRFVHLGLTSSDVLDTSFAMLLAEASDLIIDDIKRLMAAIKKRAFEHRMTPMMGRSHGIHAEPVTFGLKMALWYDEMRRNLRRMESAKETVAYGKISGAVGTFANVEPFVEEYVCKKAGLKPAPVSTQKAGDTPLLDCLNDTSLEVAPGVFGCWQLLVAGGPFHEVEGFLDSNDTRVQQVYAANGLLFTALDTAATVGGADRAGIAWFVLDPHRAQVVNQGVLAAKDANITYPAVAVTASGRGVMAFTLVGPDAFPSAGYASIDAVRGAGDIHVAAAGQGPQDGFTEYHAFAPPFRPRWGDYGAAAADGRSVWLASEYIGQSCTFDEYVATGFTCGNTRTALANWGTRISRVTP